MAWSEDRLHRWLAGRARPRVLAGELGDDAAVLRASRARTVVCVDQTIEGVHFEPELAPARVGAKAAARALSDLAASAARPRALVLAVTAPRSCDERWIRSAIGAVGRAAEAHGAALVGGDLACAPGPRALSVTAVGEAPDGRLPSRSRALAGHVVVATGPFGGSRLGRHHRFRPRTREGRWLHGLGAAAIMDVSDGLAWDLARLARASGVRIDLEHVPVHADARRAARADGRSARWHALHDGEDHELVATLPRARLARVLRAAPRHCPGLVRIGDVGAGRGLRIREDDELVPWDGKGGWRHGS